ncbi:MAG: TolC family protein [Myxococcaceae bacterium]
MPCVLVVMSVLSVTPGEPRRISLPEALAAAQAHQPSLEAARSRLEAAGVDAQAARAAWLPTVGALAEVVLATTNNSTTTVVSNGVVDLPRIGATKVSSTPDFTPAASTLLGVGARQLLFDFGRVSAQAGAADALAELERARLANLGLSLEFQVRRAFYGVLAAHAVLDASEQSWVRAKAHRDFAKTAVDAQVRSPIELTRAEADLARADLGRLRATSGLRSARVLLAALVGANEEELDADASATAAVLPPLPDAATVRAAALEAEPTLVEARAASKQARAQVDVVASQARPSLFATAALSLRNGGAAPSSGSEPGGLGLVPAVPNYDVGVVFSWPLLDVSTFRRADAAGLRARAADQDLDATGRRVAEQALQLAERARVAEDSLAALAHAVDAARANEAQAEARFKAGLGTSTELADAETLRTEAEINVAVGRFEALTARAALDRVMAREAR